MISLKLQFLAESCETFQSEPFRLILLKQDKTKESVHQEKQQQQKMGSN